MILFFYLNNVPRSRLLNDIVVSEPFDTSRHCRDVLRASRTVEFDAMIAPTEEYKRSVTALARLLTQNSVPQFWVTRQGGRLN
jgi:hypothetical protein